jgi:transcription initiation factor IIE alpha subunit
MIMEDISDKIWAKVDNGDEDIWRDITELAIERGKHPDDDMEELVNILIDQVWEGLPDG